MKSVHDMTSDEMKETIMRQKRLIRHLGKMIQTADGDVVIRVSGLAVCEKCGLEFFDHPQIDNEILNIGCDGKLRKL